MAEWLGDEDDVIRLLLEARQGVRKWESADLDLQAERAIEVRRTLGKLLTAIQTAENNLMGSELENLITEREARRRRDIILTWKQERNDMAEQLRRGVVKPIQHDFSREEVYHLQKQGHREQDALLDDLGVSLQRQQSIGGAIGVEVDESTALLKKIDSRVHLTDARVQRENQRIEEFKTPPCAIFMWVVCFFLVACLIVLLATDGGCIIVYGSKKCKDMPWGKNHSVTKMANRMIKG